MKFELKSGYTGSVLFSLETGTLKLCLEAAVKSGVNLRDVDLCGVNLCGANLRGANLCGANLSDANLRGANLCGVILCGAILCDANLSDANLRGVNLCDANLRGANLRGANLCGANLSDANLRGVKNLDKFPVQIFGHKHYLQTTQSGNLRIGCEEHSFKEWREIAEELGKENGYSPLDVEIYKLHIDHIANVSQLLWNKDEEKASA